MMCGGWRQHKPERYQLVMFRELVIKDKVVKIDINHVGYWDGELWYAYANHTLNGKWMRTKLGPVNIYGWQDFQKMEPTG